MTRPNEQRSRPLSRVSSISSTSIRSSGRSAARVAVVAALLAGALAPPRASANTPEDLQGLGARVNAMGGAGTALARDFAATYYSPANLAYCENSSLSLEMRHTLYQLELQRDPSDPELKELRDQTRVNVGFCNLLPFDFAFGLLFGTGLQNPMTLDQTTLTADPQFLLYGEPLEQLSIQLGLAYRIIPQLSVGLGVSILVNSVLAVDAAIPVLSDGSVSAKIRWDLQPRAALVVGAHAEPVPGLHFAVNYRGALFHDLDTPTNVEVDAAGLFLDVQLFIESAAWYSPQQLALGVTWDPIADLTVAFDLTWFNWARHPGPFLVVTPVGDGVSAGLDYPLREEFGFRDAWVPRIGAEGRLLGGHLALRGGYGFRGAVAPIPQQRSNVLDSAVHTFTLGGGYFFGDRPHEFTGPATGPHIRGANGSIDVYVRVHHMVGREVVRTMPMGVLDRYSFGGNMLDAGLQLSIGWF